MLDKSGFLGGFVLTGHVAQSFKIFGAYFNLLSCVVFFGEDVGSGHVLEETFIGKKNKNKNKKTSAFSPMTGRGKEVKCFSKG